MYLHIVKEDIHKEVKKIDFLGDMPLSGWGVDPNIHSSIHPFMQAVMKMCTLEFVLKEHVKKPCILNGCVR